jgi:anaerobic selenocysteine-containing dehydrogenase
VRGYPEIRSEYPVAALAEEIETPGDEQVRVVITVGGNPALSTPNSARLDAALESLDYMVSVDPYRNETTRHANVILPPPPPLARSHYDLAFYTLSVRNVANYSPPIVETDGLQESEILARLALIVSGMGSDADPATIDDLLVQTVLDRAAKSELLADRDPADLLAELVATNPADRIVEIMIRTGAYGDHFGAKPEGLTMAKLMENPHGIDLGPLQPRVPEVLSTRSGKIELAPPPIADDLVRMRDSLDRHRNGELLLVGRRHLRSNNSWMHNVNVLVKGKERCTLQMHPDDAARLGLADGANATVTSRVGAVVAPVEVTADVMTGVVSLPHGWGHDQDGVQMTVAAGRPGVNSNILTDEQAIDPLSGNAVLNAIPVTVAPA